MLGEAGDILSTNMYAYCANNPVMNVDPTGCWSWSTFWKGAWMVATAIVAVALAVTTFGAGIPIAMAIVAGITLIAGVLTGINGIATMVEAGTDNNFVRDGVFNEVLGLSDNAYNTYASVTEGVAVVGSMILGVYHTTGQYKAAKCGQDFLGKGYSKEGPGRWVSKDGMRQLRIDSHPPFGNHFNFDTFKTNYWQSNRTKIKDTAHQVYKWFRTWIE
jgi:hypothetical protein